MSAKKNHCRFTELKSWPVHNLFLGREKGKWSWVVRNLTKSIYTEDQRKLLERYIEFKMLCFQETIKDA